MHMIYEIVLKSCHRREKTGLDLYLLVVFNVSLRGFSSTHA